jgi:CheY-like chemotaxis protein
MPRLSGFDLSRQLLAIRPDIPIIMTTGYVRPDDHERACRMGLRDLILKPIPSSNLAAHLIAFSTTNPPNRDFLCRCSALGGAWQ